MFLDISHSFLPGQFLLRPYLESTVPFSSNLAIWVRLWSLHQATQMATAKKRVAKPSHWHRHKPFIYISYYFGRFICGPGHFPMYPAHMHLGGLTFRTYRLTWIEVVYKKSHFCPIVPFVTFAHEARLNLWDLLMSHAQTGEQ